MLRRNNTRVSRDITMTTPAVTMKHSKVFRDTVHGYIEVPSHWCDSVIDTPLFQRLRCIEQTSMRCLYPSARHDRFIHSLGTFHIGQKAFDSLVNNSEGFFIEIGLQPNDIQKFRNVFLLACLLHDCAHAPFSHTFEYYYDRRKTKGDTPSLLDQQLITEMAGDDRFLSDFKDSSPKPHEKASAIILLRLYADQFTDRSDAQLAARMIIGCQYRGTVDGMQKFANVLISLLNGKAIDVDKLDYITRDTWASGVDNTSIDIHRLLSSIQVVQRKTSTMTRYVIAFRRNALSVIQQVVNAKNYIYRWIYGHHMVMYSQHILQKAVEATAEKLGDDNEGNLTRIFSIDTFLSPIEVGNFSFHQVTDGDLIYLLKLWKSEIPEANAWLSRKHLHKAVWKTQAEYEHFFRDLTPKEHEVLLSRVNDNILHELYPDSPFICCDVQMNDVVILRNELFVLLNSEADGLVPYTDIACYNSRTEAVETAAPQKPDFFYLYQPIGCTAKPMDVVSFLIEQVKT